MLQWPLCFEASSLLKNKSRTSQSCKAGKVKGYWRQSATCLALDNSCPCLLGSCPHCHVLSITFPEIDLLSVCVFPCCQTLKPVLCNGDADAWIFTRRKMEWDTHNFSSSFYMFLKSRWMIIVYVTAKLFYCWGQLLCPLFLKLQNTNESEGGAEHCLLNSGHCPDLFASFIMPLATLAGFMV